MKSELGTLMQLGYVVKDIEATMRELIDVFGIGPFLCVDDIAMVGAEHRGVTLDTHLKVAFSYMGTAQIEVIQPLDDQPTVYQEFLSSGRSGLHHLGFWPEDFDRAYDKLTTAGYRPALHMRMDPLPANYYFDPPDGGTVMVELSHATPGKAEHYRVLREFVADWDGNNPIRHYRTRDDLAADIGAPALTATRL